jgi:hypothetical protein
MNKTIKISSLLSTIFILIGAIFKMNHWPFASFALLIGITLFNFLFLPFYASYLIKVATDKPIKIILISLAVSISVFTITTLFQIQHWPGSGVVAMISGVVILLMCLLIIPILVSKINACEVPRLQKISLSMIYFGGILFFLGILSKMVLTNYSNEILFIGVVVLLTGILIYNHNHEKGVIKFFNEKVQLSYLYTQIFNFLFLTILLKAPHSYNAEFNLINNRVLTSISKIDDFTKGKIKQQTPVPKIVEVNHLTEDVLQYIDDLKGGLVKMVYKDNTLEMAKTDMNKLRNIDNFDLPTSFLIGSDPALPKKGQYTANELKNKLIAYKIHLLSMVEESDKVAMEKKMNLDFSDKVEDDITASWEVYTFLHTTLAHDLIALSQIQLEIKMTETIIVDYLSQKVNN